MSGTEDLQAEHEALLGFLYMCPVGILRVALNGDVQMINPLAAQLLLPLMDKPDLRNLFEATTPWAPELRDMVSDFSPASGMVCQQHRIFVNRPDAAPRVLAATLLKVDPSRLMAVLQDVTQLVEQERELRQNEAMFAALGLGAEEFALLSLDAEGLIDSWNVSGRRQTGFAIWDVLGNALDIFAERGDGDGIAETLEKARREGWSQHDGWCRRRDGSRYRCRIMIAANRATEERFQDPFSIETDVAVLRTATGAARPDITGFAVVLRELPSPA